MSASPPDFGRLQKLLLLKRHEQPPPGYFANFSDKVIARIEAGRLAVRSSWWQQLRSGLDAKPLVACGYGCMVAGLLVIGVGVSQTVEPDNTAASIVVDPWYTPTPEVAPTLFVSSASPHSAIERTDSSSSVTPVMISSAPGFLFDVNRLKPEPASYNFR
jgi:hypothetical protein